MDEQLYTPPQKITHIVVAFILVMFVAGGVWFHSYLFPQKFANTVSTFTEHKSNILPPEFPAEFPNPASPEDVVMNTSFVVGSGPQSDQLMYVFKTTESPEDILKLYNDYFVKNKWTVKPISIPNMSSIIANKSFTVASVTVSTATTTPSLNLVSISVISRKNVTSSETKTP